MVARKIPDVHLETMEAPTDKGKEPDETGTTGMVSLRSGLLPKGTLEMHSSR